MKVKSSSVINEPIYLMEKNQSRNRWIILIALLVLTSIFFFSSLFRTTLGEIGQSFNELSLSAQIDLLNRIFNPAIILFCLLCLGLIIHLAKKTVKHQTPIQGITDQLVDINDAGWNQSEFGPGFIPSGVRNVIIIKNYQGFLKIFLPVYPSVKDRYFFTKNEKIDQILDIQAHSTKLGMHCRTKDGILLSFPEVSISFRFIVKSPTSQGRYTAASSKQDHENIKNYLLRKGNLSLTEIVVLHTRIILASTIGDYLLDEIQSANVAFTKDSPEETNNPLLADLRKYKEKSLRKHWHVYKRVVQTKFLLHSKKMQTHSVRSHRKQMRSNPIGTRIFSSRSASQDNSFQNHSQNLGSLIEKELTAELKKYNIDLLSIDILHWQPVEALIKQKIQKNHLDNLALFEAQKTFDPYLLMQEAKSHHLALLQEQSLLTNQNINASVQKIGADSILLAKAQHYGIPGIPQLGQNDASPSPNNKDLNDGSRKD